jgi:hypothetical protein
MKRITGLIIFICLSSLSIYSQPDMQKYLNDTRVLVKQGKYQEALERHIWFHEHALEYDKAMLGVRTSFALSDWKNLGKVYPPALDSLKKTRDRKMEKILTDQYASIQSSANDQHIGMLFQDMTSINRVLEEDSITVQFFQSLILLNPETAGKCWIYAKEALFNEKRFDILNIYIKSPVNEYREVKNRYLSEVNRDNNIKVARESLKTYSEIRFIEKCTQLIQFSLYNNDEKSAKEIHDEAISIIENDLLRLAIDAELHKQSGATFIDLNKKKSMYDEMAKEVAKMQHQIDSSITQEKAKLYSITIENTKK